MNKIYRVVYNKHTGAYVAVAETTAAKGKTSTVTMASDKVDTVSIRNRNGLINSFKSVSTSLGFLSVLGLLIMPEAQASYTNNEPVAGAPSYGTAGGTGRIAIGADIAANQKAYANADYATAIGANAMANGLYSTALGVNSSAKGANSVAMGTTAIATGTAAIAVGKSANAVGNNGIAIGENTGATGASAVAIGTGRTASTLTSAGMQSVSLGYTARSEQNAVAIGTYSYAGNDSIAMGNGAEATQVNTIAIGKNAYTGIESIHIGTTKVRGNASNHTGAFRRGSTLIGYESVGQGLYTTVIGNNSQLLSNEQTVATGLIGRTFDAQNAFSNILGAYNKVGDIKTTKTFNGVAVSVVGAANKVTESNGAFIAGYGNTVTNSYKDSIDVSGVLATNGTFDTSSSIATMLANPATELGQTGVIGAANKLDNANNTLIMGMRNDVVTANKSSVTGFNHVIQNINNSSINGVDITAKNVNHVFNAGVNNQLTNVENITALGSNMTIGSATTTAKNSILLGNYIDFATKSDMSNAVSIGDYSRANTGAVAIGVTAQALGADSIAIGRGAVSTGSIATGLDAKAGNGGTAYGDGSMATYLNGSINSGTVAGAALGQNALADISGAVALGTNATVTIQNSVALGVNSTADTAATPVTGYAGSAPVGVVSVGTVNEERQIQNVAAGRINSTSTDAINGSQLYALQNLASSGWNLQTDGDTATAVKPGDTIDIGLATGENNIKVSRNGNVIDFELNKNLNLGSTGSVVMGDVLVNNQGLTITNGPSVTVKGIDAGSKVISNVEAGKKGTDAVNVNQLTEIQTVVTKGWNLQTDGDTATAVKPGDTIDIGLATGENNIKVSRNGNVIDFELNKNLNLGSTGSVVMEDVLINNQGLTITNGPSVTVKGIDAGNKVINNVAPGTSLTDAVNLNQLNQAINGTKYAGLKVQNGSDIITANESLNIEGKDGTTVTYDKNTNTYTVSSKSAGTGNGSMSSWNLIGKGESGNSVNIPITDGKDAGFVAGSNNITVTPSQTESGAQVKVDLSKDLNLNSITTKNTDGNSTVLNGDGMTIKKKDGKDGASITQSGIDAGNQTLTNVAVGKEDTDAVNVSQLKEVGSEINKLSSRVDSVENNANAGTAAAIAVATLPQPVNPGDGGMSLGMATYEGEAGYSLGYSTISEGGNWVFKAAATGNSRGKFGAGVGVFLKLH